MTAAYAGTFARPKTLAEALEALGGALASGKRPMLLGGGTDAMVDRHLNGARWGEAVVDLTAVRELRRVERSVGANGSVRYVLGAGVTYAAMRAHGELAREVPLLAAMAREVGAVQIQERGTLGGNLATGSPAADGVPALAALDAAVLLVSADGGRRRVALREFYTGYRKSVMRADELVDAVEFEAPKGPWFWRKVGTRMAQSIAKVALAATARVEQGLIADVHFGMASVAPTTALLSGVREAMVGKRPEALDAKALSAALARDIAPIDDVRSTAEYRRHVAERLVVQFAAALGARDLTPTALASLHPSPSHGPA